MDPFEMTKCDMLQRIAVALERIADAQEAMTYTMWPDWLPPHHLRSQSGTITPVVAQPDDIDVNNAVALDDVPF